MAKQRTFAKVALNLTNPSIPPICIKEKIESFTIRPAISRLELAQSHGKYLHRKISMTAVHIHNYNL